MELVVFIPKTKSFKINLKIIFPNLLNSIYGCYCEILKDGLANRKLIIFKFRKECFMSIEKVSIFRFIYKNNIQELLFGMERPAEVFL